MDAEKALTKLFNRHRPLRGRRRHPHADQRKRNRAVAGGIVVCGAEPLLTDYICVGKVHPERVAAVVKGIAEGCVLAGCALVGGKSQPSTRVCWVRTTSTSPAPVRAWWRPTGCSARTASVRVTR
ncbi:Phosphoribosylformylglycinamidine cyclo-ligase [Streptomyces griseoloalbus]